MTDADNPILAAMQQAGFDTLVALLQSVAGHEIIEQGSPTKIVMVMPESQFAGRFEYSLELARDGVNVLANDDFNEDGKFWKLTARDLVERIDGWLCKIETQNYPLRFR